MDPTELKRSSSPTLSDSISTPSSLPSLTDEEQLDFIHYPETFQLVRINNTQREPESQEVQQSNRKDTEQEALEERKYERNYRKQLTSEQDHTSNDTPLLNRSHSSQSETHRTCADKEPEKCQEFASERTVDTEDTGNQPEVHKQHGHSVLKRSDPKAQEERKDQSDLQRNLLTSKEASTREEPTTMRGMPPTQLVSHTTSADQKPEPYQEFASMRTGNQQPKPSLADATGSTINPFRRMIRQVGKKLTASDVDEMVYLTEQSPDLMKEKDYQDRPFYHLMTTLEIQGKVTESNVDLLVECLEEIQSTEALQLVRSYCATPPGPVESKDPVKELSGTRRTSHVQHIEQPPITDERQDERQQHQNFKTSETLDLLIKEKMSEIFSPQKTTLVCSWQDASLMLKDIGIEKASGDNFNIMDCMTLHESHLNLRENSAKNVVMTFLSRIMSFDHRAMNVFKDLDCSLGVSPVRENNLSCRDVMFGFLSLCDPFLRQEVLSKMAACQIAVPVLLPNLKHNSISLLIWGLQRIKKVWVDRKSAKVQEQIVTKFPFPVVAFLRYGHTGWSKSSILNKMLGSIQGNNDHPYFISNEQDRRPSVLSHGAVEAVWYHSRAHDDGKYSLTEALCFLNLRGDANDFPVQQHFIGKYSLIVIVFVSQADLLEVESMIAPLSKESNVIVVVNKVSYPAFAKGKLDRNPICMSHVKELDLTGCSTLEISEVLCAEIKNILSLPDRKPALPLEDSVSFCDTLQINADILEKNCRDAKEIAEDILLATSQGSKQYKQCALPLQDIWLKWSQLDKDRTWKGNHGNTERQISRLHTEKQEQRRRQRQKGVSEEMKKMHEALSRPSESFKQFLVFWLQHYLNKLSFDTLRPLMNKLKEVSSDARDTAAEITQLKRRLSCSSIMNKEMKGTDDRIKEMTARERKLQQELSKLTKEFDACSLGFEHFVREFGQIYECFHNSQEARGADQPPPPINVGSLPLLAADLLLSGQPLEIFDGDACHVPIKWVTGVLKAVRDATGNSRIYVISVIGIQSSGKSTLLNSMFGVRFAVSAGRCTRGVFLQLLPLSNTLKKKLRCAFIAVIDTEGLKAPEKALSSRKNEDNELATFALCISDMTLINIGGQTVGEDLSNILQISAHAFIRMKEVHLRSSCYLIQQFVADITAQYRNQNSTESILQTLDQAVVTAAIEERKQDQYRQFSDCFNIVNIGNNGDKVQYIPSLWRTSMSAPNHEYSETVLKLKSELLQEIQQKDHKQTVDEFSNRIVSVWKAVKEEDFVFNFRNTNEIAQYNNFSRWYQKELLKLTKDIMKWELDAKTKIKNTAAEHIRDFQQTLFKQLKTTVDLNVDRIQSAMDENLQNGEYDCVKSHANYFFRDLNNQGHQIHDTVRKALNLEASVIINAKTKDNEYLPAIKAKLRRQVFPLAERMQLTLPQNDDPNMNPDLPPETEDLVKRAFEQEWDKQMRDVQLEYPTRSPGDIRSSIETDIEECIVECLKNTDLSKDMKQLLDNYKVGQLCQTSPPVTCKEDIHKVSQLTRSCSKTLTENLNYLKNCVLDAIHVNSFCFSKQFLHDLRKALIPIILHNCPGCKHNTGILLCVSCQVLREANEATEETILTKIMKSKKLMEQLDLKGIPTQWVMQRDVNLRLKNLQPKIASGVIHKMKTWVGDILWSNDAEIEGNFYNQVQIQFSERRRRINKKRWYSAAETGVFITMVLQLLEDRNVPERRYQHLLAEACRFFINEAIESEKKVVRDILSWEKAEDIMAIETLSILKQRDLFIKTFQDVLPHPVISSLRSMSDETIRKFASVPLTEDIRHAIEECFISLMPVLDTDKYETILSITQDSRDVFLGLIQDSGLYSENIGRTLVTSTLEEITDNTGLGKVEQAVTIAYVCSWALPICIDMTIAFERKHSIEALLEEEKEILYTEFKSLCNGACKDQLAAKSFCAIVQTSLEDALKNRLCGSLFERLCTAGNDIFCSRPRFLQTVLEQLCEEQSFGNYTAFLRQHYSFIKKWTLQFMARECCPLFTDHIRIQEVAIREISQLLDETEESFNTALRFIQENEREGDALDVWLDTFIDSLENRSVCTLNEEKVAHLYNCHEITDFPLFTKECIKIIKSFQHNALLVCLHLPDMRSTKSIAAWFKNHLPKQLHVLLADSVRGCGSQCPFCKTFCDDTVKEHKVHFSNLHYPIGIGGMSNRRTSRLGSSTCVANVATDTESYYICHCGHDSECNHPTTLFQNYKEDYPDWDILPVSDYEPTIYWKWVLSHFNQGFASYYRCKPAIIPWDTVTKDEALASVRQMYSLEVPEG